MNHNQVFHELYSLSGSKQAQFERLVSDLSTIIPDFDFSMLALYFVNNISEAWISDSGEVFDRYDTWVQEWRAHSAQIELEAHSAQIE